MIYYQLRDTKTIVEDSLITVVTYKQIPLTAVVTYNGKEYKILQHLSQFEKNTDKELYVYIAEERRGNERGNY